MTHGIVYNLADYLTWPVEYYIPWVFDMRCGILYILGIWCDMLNIIYPDNLMWHVEYYIPWVFDVTCGILYTLTIWRDMLIIIYPGYLHGSLNWNSRLLTPILPPNKITPPSPACTQCFNEVNYPELHLINHLYNCCLWTNTSHSSQQP